MRLGNIKKSYFINYLILFYINICNNESKFISSFTNLNYAFNDSKTPFFEKILNPSNHMNTNDNFVDNSSAYENRLFSLVFSSENLRSCIKYLLIFLFIYSFLILPFGDFINKIDKKLVSIDRDPANKIIAISLISNPETLYLLALNSMKEKNYVKADMYISTAIGIVEISSASIEYKKKFHILRAAINKFL